LEVSALKYSGGIGLHGRSPLLRLQSDERLVALVRRGNNSAFEVLVSRYESRLLAFCRHLLGSREDAEDVLQEVMAASYNAMIADDRSINVRPWLYRIARNRSLNHLRRIQAVGVDSIDIHLSDHGATTADKAHEREEFRLLVGDINDLPETQKTALVLREMDALSYDQIAEAMETTVPSVKSLLVRARVSLAEAAEARMLSCDEVRIELGELAEGLRRRPSPLVRRHLKGCDRCSIFRKQLRETNKALAAVMPIGPLVLLKKFILIHFGHSAGSGATAAGSGAAGSTAAAGGTIMAGTTGGSFVSAGMGALATKAAAGLAVATLVTAGAVEVDHSLKSAAHPRTGSSTQARANVVPVVHATRHYHHTAAVVTHRIRPRLVHAIFKKAVSTKPTLLASVTKPVAKPTVTKPAAVAAKPPVSTLAVPTTLPGRTQSQSDPTVLTPGPTTTTITTPAPTTTSPPTTAPPATAPVIPPTPPPASGTGTPSGGSGPGSTSSGPGTGTGAPSGSSPRFDPARRAGAGQHQRPELGHLDHPVVP
jgi:RNA polymerase sigma factor (sigma-70 family)